MQDEYIKYKEYTLLNSVCFHFSQFKTEYKELNEYLERVSK